MPLRPWLDPGPEHGTIPETLDVKKHLYSYIQIPFIHIQIECKYYKN